MREEALLVCVRWWWGPGGGESVSCTPAMRLATNAANITQGSNMAAAAAEGGGLESRQNVTHWKTSKQIYNPKTKT